MSLPQVAALPRDARSGLFHRSCFAYDAASDAYRCPAGQTLTHFRNGKRRDQHGSLDRKRYRTEVSGTCAGCTLAAQCCTNPRQGREINRIEFEDAKERMRERMKTDEGKARYKLRGQSAEPRIGTLKCGLQMRKFLRRSVEKVRMEWRWVCTAFNIGALIAHWDQTKLALT